MKCKDQNLVIDDSVDDIDIENYKGIYFNDEQTNRYEDKITGAHFDYFDLCRRLRKLPNVIKKSEENNNNIIDVKNLKKFDLTEYLKTKENIGKEGKHNNNSQKNYYVTNLYNYKFEKSNNLNISINNNMIPFSLMRNKMFSIDKTKKFRNKSSEFNDVDKMLSGSESEEIKVEGFHKLCTIGSKPPCFGNLGRNHLPISKTNFQKKYQIFSTKHNCAKMNSNRNKKFQENENKREKCINNLLRPNTSVK